MENKYGCKPGEKKINGRCMTQIGQIGIDSAHVIITDPIYLSRNDYNKVSRELDNKGSPPYMSKEDEYVVSQTGYGDGIYPVYAEMKEGRVSQIVIDTGTQGS